MTNQYIFTQDWFSINVPVLNDVFSKYKGVPCQVLEIGSFEGRSTVWFIENILTHADSRILSIDPCTGNIEHAPHEVAGTCKHYAHNVLLHHSHKALFYKGFSSDVLKYHNIMATHFDIVYIDGDHRAHAVLEDAVLSFRMLKEGGYMVFDDMKWPAYKDDPPNHPFTGFQAFYHAYGKFIKIIHDGYQIIVQKIGTA